MEPLFFGLLLYDLGRFPVGWWIVFLVKVLLRNPCCSQGCFLFCSINFSFLSHEFSCPLCRKVSLKPDHFSLGTVDINSASSIFVMEYCVFFWITKSLMVFFSPRHSVLEDSQFFNSSSKWSHFFNNVFFEALKII